jgi:hypothetical protein
MSDRLLPEEVEDMEEVRRTIHMPPEWSEEKKDKFEAWLNDELTRDEETELLKLGKYAPKRVAFLTTPDIEALTKRVAELEERSRIPPEVARQVLSMGRVEWGATDKLTEAGHLEHLAETLRNTRKDFNFEDVPVAMHGLYLEGTGTVLCHTGTSPNSGPNAQALAGAWNWLHDQCAASYAGSKPGGPEPVELGSGSREPDNVQNPFGSKGR